MAASVAASIKSANTIAGSTFESASITPAGTGRVLYALIGSGAGAGVVLACSVKYCGSGGVEMTLLVTAVESPYWAVSLYRLIDPSTAGGTIYATFPSSQDEHWCIAVAVQDADTVTPNGTVTENRGTNSAPSTVDVPSVANDLVLDFTSFFHGGGVANWIATPGAGQTAVQKLDDGQVNVYEGSVVSSEIAAGASTTMSWTYSVAAPAIWLVWGLNVNAGSGGGGPPPHTHVRELRNLKRTFRPRPFAPG